MSRLVISTRHLHTAGRHASVSYPDECCGVLIGRSLGDAANTTVVERVLSVGNERNDSRHNRYLINPETVLAAHKEARALGLDVVGYYHSHPDHPARPSDFDREHAWPGVSYLIISVLKREVADIRSWRLADDREQFDEEEIDQSASGFGQKEAV
ncbi:MAG TPA: M67 family metallopeptidase [Thermoanaerobaculia bacterium]|nr:M67 family metallopeptidase [Thermoanaerobaculia bacterium]